VVLVFCQVGFGLGQLLGWISYGLDHLWLLLSWLFAGLAMGWASLELSWLWSFGPGWRCARLAFAKLLDWLWTWLAIIGWVGFSMIGFSLGCFLALTEFTFCQDGFLS